LYMQDYQLIKHAYNLIGSFKHVNSSKPFHVLPVSQRSCSLSVLCYHHRVPPNRLRSSAKQNKSHGQYFLFGPRTLQAAQVARVVLVYRYVCWFANQVPFFVEPLWANSHPTHNPAGRQTVAMKCGNGPNISRILTCGPSKLSTCQLLHSSFSTHRVAQIWHENNRFFIGWSSRMSFNTGCVTLDTLLASHFVIVINQLVNAECYKITPRQT
jgi:hypothetical protein